MTVNPGFLTSEWWAALAAHGIAAAALFHVAVSANLAQGLTGLAAAIGPELGAAWYAHSRARVKAAAIVARPPAVAPAAPPPQV